MCNTLHLQSNNIYKVRYISFTCWYTSTQYSCVLQVYVEMTCLSLGTYLIKWKNLTSWKLVSSLTHKHDKRPWSQLRFISEWQLHHICLYTCTTCVPLLQYKSKWNTVKTQYTSTHMDYIYKCSILGVTNEICLVTTLGKGTGVFFKFSDLHDIDISDGGFEGCDIVQTCEVEPNILDAHLF